MKKFLAVYLGSESSPSYQKWQALDEEAKSKREEAGVNGWVKWGNANARSIVDGGTPLGATKRINSDGVTDGHNQICAYTIVQAESHEAAAKLFSNHPHFTILPGDSIEIMECLPVPGT